MNAYPDAQHYFGGVYLRSRIANVHNLFLAESNST